MCVWGAGWSEEFKEHNFTIAIRGRRRRRGRMIPMAGNAVSRVVDNSNKHRVYIRNGKQHQQP